MRKTLLIALVIVSGCASGPQAATGTKHPAIDPAQVRIYGAAPQQYESLGVVVGRAHKTIWGHRSATHRAVLELKEEAAAKGANGVLLSPAEAKLISTPNPVDQFDSERHTVEISGTAIFVP